MSLLPKFLNAGPALLAAAAAVPLLLVLYFLKLRRQERPVSSTLLWRKAIQDLQVNAPFQRLRRNLLLLLQLLLLALLCLALARPVINYLPGAGKLCVILIDRSASMSAADIDGGKRTRLEEAQRQARDLVATLDRGAMALAIAFDDSAEIVQNFTSDTQALRSAIDSIRPTDRRSRLKLAYQLAEAQTNFNPEQLRSHVKPDIHLFSDGRVLDDPRELSVRGELRYWKIGTDAAKNIAVVALSARRNYERPTEVQVFARLANYGPEPVAAQVELRVDNQDPRIAGTWLLPQRWTEEERRRAEAGGKAAMARDSVQFTLELLGSAVIRVQQMERDALPADDAAAVVVPPPKNLAVLLVTDGNYFLEKAVDSLPLEKHRPMLPTAYEQEKPAKYDVIIFDRYQPQFLPPAGNFVYFGAAPATGGLTAEQEGPRSMLIADQAVLDWRRDHPILRHLSLGKLYAAQALRLKVAPEAEVLMDGVKGPLLALHRQGRSTHLVVAFDVLQSNWPLRVSFPIFLSNALQYLAVGSAMDVRESYPPGATPRIARHNLQRVDVSLGSVTVRGPGMNAAVQVPPAGDFVLPPLQRVGVYSLDPPVPQHEKIAVNLLDGGESNLVPADTAPGGDAPAISAATGKRRLELWWWIVACVALPLLLLEWWVYTRRVHL